ncbi:MAG: alpha/beta fold hydrolase, partial [Plesiomonas shigelloides]
MINYKQQGEGPVLVLIHGLFGTLDNLGLLDRDLVNDYRIIQVDLRTHGQ